MNADVLKFKCCSWNAAKH